MCSQSPDVIPSQSTCRQDRLGARWDSRLGISSDKVLSHPSTHFLLWRSLVVGTRPSSRRYNSCWHAGEFPFNWKLSELPPHPRIASDDIGPCRAMSDHTGLSLTDSITQWQWQQQQQQCHQPCSCLSGDCRGQCLSFSHVRHL
jgi:hypothetical protein